MSATQHKLNVCICSNMDNVFKIKKGKNEGIYLVMFHMQGKYTNILTLKSQVYSKVTFM